MAKKHWATSEIDLTTDNLRHDINKFIELQTGLCVGSQLEDDGEDKDRWIIMLGWYDGVKFSFPIDTKNKTVENFDFYGYQKEIYDYCKLWNKGETREHRETAKHKKMMDEMFAA